MAMVLKGLHLTWKYTHCLNPHLLNMTFNTFTINVCMLTWNATSNIFMVHVCMPTFDATSNAFMIDVCLPTSFQDAMSKTFDIPSNTRPLSNVQLLLALKNLTFWCSHKKKPNLFRHSQNLFSRHHYGIPSLTKLSFTLNLSNSLTIHPFPSQIEGIRSF